ncbi:MAG: trimethylamine methyltransferase family protein [Thermoguttaceae bacterium]|nr:trimethylamine methyltransferase family protein [Thermoguttaceae bacterium]MDW8037226.1 trimethylamine methyltransferase family protein [Thermoguttaceae bacterium]
MELAKLRVLSDEEIQQIHNATLEILSQCGVKMHHRPMLQFLKDKGLAVDMETGIVRFSPTAIEDALAAAPAQFEVFDRQGRFAYVLGDRRSKIAAGHNAVFWVDSETGQTRPARVADVELFARICQQLECIDMIGIPVMPQDVPEPRATLLYGVRATIENSTKPIYFSTDNGKTNRACIELARAAFAGRLEEQVYAISQLSSTSPLYWEGGVLDAIMDTVPSGVPLAILPEPIAGFTAPYTLAGLVTMNNAECLSGLVMIQLLRPGAKFLYANSWTTLDMRTASALVGSTETNICRIAGAQLAHFYRLPCHTTAPNSDNHAHDEQNAWEKTFSQFCAVAAGNDLIVNCGMFATGLTCSHEQLLMDEEISAMARRIAEGLLVTPETIAVDLIRQIGPRGEGYLTCEHTLRWLRSKEYVRPRLSVCGPRTIWEARGAKDTYQIARDKVRQYAAQTEPTHPLPESIRHQLAEIIASFERDLP